MTDKETTPNEESASKPPEDVERRHPRKEAVKELKEKATSLEKALAEEKKRSEDYFTKLQYLQADFDNYTKRVRKEVQDEIRHAKERLILELLGAVESMEKAVEAAQPMDDSPLKSGVEMVLKEITQLLRQEGLTEIKAAGELFDPNRHEAVGQVETEDAPEGKVIRELRKGYMLHEKVLRPSMVEVAKKRSPTDHVTENSEEVTEDERG